MDWLWVVLLLPLAAGIYLAFGVLTAMGQRRRGGSAPVVAAAVLFFPIYWVAWHMRDNKSLDREP